MRIVTPGVTALEYAHRRSRLANKLPKGAIAVLASSEVKYRAPGIFHEYRQESNFFYLTGRRREDFRRGGLGADHVCSTSQGLTSQMLWPSSEMMDPATTTSSISTCGRRILKRNSGMGRGLAPKLPWTCSMRMKCVPRIAAHKQFI